MIRPRKSRLVPSFLPFASIASFPMVAAILAGCMSQQHLARGERAYNAGDYPAAKQQLLDAEKEKRDYTGRELAELALYRGLTAEALGNKLDAAKWLAEAKIREAKDPGSLNEDEQNKLDLGLRALLHDPPR